MKLIFNAFCFQVHFESVCRIVPQVNESVVVALLPGVLPHVFAKELEGVAPDYPDFSLVGELREDVLLEQRDCLLAPFHDVQ